MPAVTYTPAMRVMNADYAISGETGLTRGILFLEKWGFILVLLKLSISGSAACCYCQSALRKFYVWRRCIVRNAFYVTTVVKSSLLSSVRDLKLDSLYGCFKCWEFQPGRSFGGHPVPSCCHMWGTGWGEEEVAIILSRSWSRSGMRTRASVSGLAFFQGAFQPVLGHMGIISCTATKLYKKQFGGISKNQGCSLRKLFWIFLSVTRPHKK